MKKWITGVVLLAVVLGGLYFAGVYLTGGFDGGLGVTFFDENGDPVGVPLAFMDPSGNIVAGFKATVWWKIGGMNIDPATASITGTLKVFMLSEFDRWIKLTEASISSSSAESDFSKSYDFDTLLADYMSEEYQTMGWPMKVESSITSQISDTEGNALDPQTKTGLATFTITWYEGSYNLESGVNIVYP